MNDLNSLLWIWSIYPDSYRLLDCISPTKSVLLWLVADLCLAADPTLLWLPGWIYQCYKWVSSKGCSWPRQCFWCNQVPWSCCGLPEDGRFVGCEDYRAGRLDKQPMCLCLSTKDIFCWFFSRPNFFSSLYNPIDLQNELFFLCCHHRICFAI